MKCPKCGSSNEAGSGFCVSCGGRLNGGERPPKREVPAQQAEKLMKEAGKIGKEAGELGKELGKEVGKKAGLLFGKLTRGEKVVGAGALIALISFFVTWFSLDKFLARNLDVSETMSGFSLGGWVWLLPILMVVSLALLYFSIGASAKTKAMRASYCLFISTIFATASVTALILIAELQKTLKEAELPIGNILTVEFGWWLLVFGSLAMIVGSFWVQRENLKD